MKMNHTAIIYARVSTVKQADDGLPVESQIEQGHRKAAAIEADVVRVFTDAGISGRTDVRPAFREAISYCQAHSVDFFICWSTSRFARNKLDAALYKRDLEKGGTRVIYVSVDLDNRTDSGWMMESMLEIFDEHYSRQVSADTLRSMEKNARDGFFNGGRIAFGYRTIADGKRKRLAIDETEAATVRDIFRMYVEGSGCKTVAMWLNEKGRHHRGRPWQKNTIASLLKNDVYTGHIVFNRTNSLTGALRPRGEWIMVKAHEPIIDDIIFAEAQELFGVRSPAESSGSPHSRFAFTGLLRCGQCGGSMQTESATGRGRTYHYYNCRTAQKGQGCGNRRVAAHALDEWLIDTILDRILTAEEISRAIREIHELAGEWIKDRARRRDSVVADMRVVEGKLRKLFEVLELHGKEAPNLTDLTDRMRDLKRQRNELEASLINLEEENMPILVVSPDEIGGMGEMLRDIVKSTKDPVKLRLFFSSFIKGITIDGARAQIEYRPEKLVNRTEFNVVRGKANWLPDLILLRTAIIEASLPVRFRHAA